MSMGHCWNETDRKTEVLGEKSVPVCFHLPPNPHELGQYWIQVSVMRDLLLAAF